MDRREELLRELRSRLPLWKAMAQLGLDINTKGVEFHRNHQVRKELITDLIFKDRVFHRVWQKANYGETDYRLVGSKNEILTGILEEDLPGWLEYRQLKPEHLFCSIYAADKERRRITHIILNKTIDLPKREVTLPVPVYLPRKQDDTTRRTGRG